MRSPYIQRYPILDPVFQTLSALGAGLIVGGLTLLLEPTWIIGITFGVIAFLISLRRPEFIVLAIILFTSTIIDHDSIPLVEIGGVRVLITDFFLVGMGLLMMVQWLLRNKIDFQLTGLNLLLILFIASAYLATVIGLLRGTVVIEGAVVPVRSITYFAIFFAFTNLLKSKQQAQTFLRGFFLFSAIVAVVMLFQTFLGTETQFLAGRIETLYTEGQAYQGVTRITDFPGETIIAIGFIVKTIQVFSGPIRFKRISDLFLWALLGIALIVTFNRNYWIATIVAILIFMVISSSKIRQQFIRWSTLVALATLIILVPIYFSPQNKAGDLLVASVDRFSSLFQIDTFQSVETSTFRWRDFEYEHAIDVVAKHPITGLGLGANYRPFLFGYDHQNFDGRNYIHNGHLGYMYQTGLLGYGLLLMVSAVFLYRGFKLRRQIEDENLHAVILGFTLSYLGILIGSVTTPIFNGLDAIPLIGMMWGFNELVFARHGSQEWLEKQEQVQENTASQPNYT